MLITRKLYEDRIYTSNFSSKFENGGLEYHTDIPRLKKGLSSGAFWVAWVTCPAWDADFSDATYDPSTFEPFPSPPHTQVSAPSLFISSH